MTGKMLNQQMMQVFPQVSHGDITVIIIIATVVIDLFSISNHIQVLFSASLSDNL